jgi:hypothetical protein
MKALGSSKTFVRASVKRRDHQGIVAISDVLALKVATHSSSFLLLF